MGFHRFGHRAMHTHVALLLETEDQAAAEDAAMDCWALLDQLDSLLSRFRYGSDLSVINSMGKQGSVLIHDETYRCLDSAAKAHELTNGVFDITILPIGEWDREARPESSVASPAWKAAKALVGNQGWSIAEGKVHIHRAGLQLDLGGIGKGYALDRMADVLHSHGISKALINTGESTLLATGQKRWSIAPQDDRQPLTLYQEALSSSSNSNRHIIDPRTCKPAKSPWLTTIVKAPSAALADALSTAFMILNEQEIRESCHAHPPFSAQLYRSAQADPIIVGHDPF